MINSARKRAPQLGPSGPSGKPLVVGRLISLHGANDVKPNVSIVGPGLYEDLRSWEREVWVLRDIDKAVRRSPNAGVPIFWTSEEHNSIVLRCYIFRRLRWEVLIFSDLVDEFVNGGSLLRGFLLCCHKYYGV